MSPSPRQFARHHVEMVLGMAVLGPMLLRSAAYGHPVHATPALAEAPA